MIVGQAFRAVAIVYFVTVSTDVFSQFVLDKTHLCEKKWVTYAGNEPGQYPRIVKPSTYQVYYANGKGVVRDVANDQLRWKFRWKFNATTSAIDIVFKGRRWKRTKVVEQILHMDDKELVIEKYRKRYPSSAQRLYHKQLDEVPKRKDVWDSLLIDRKRNRRYDLIRLPEMPDIVPISAYYPKRYSVKSYQVIGKKIYFVTLGAGLLVYDTEQAKWSKMDVTNTPGLPLKIGSVKDDGTGGLWVGSYALTHFTPGSVTHYYLAKEEEIRGLGLSIIGHDIQGNLLMTDKNALVMVDTENLSMLALSGRDGKEDSSGYNNKLKMPILPSPDCDQLTMLPRGIATVQNDTLFFFNPRRNCESNEYRYVYEDRSDIIQWGGCKCEFRGDRWTARTAFGKDSYVPYRKSGVYQSWHSGQIGFDNKRKVDGSSTDERNRFFSWFGLSEKLDITEQLGIWKLDRQSEEYQLMVRYKFASEQDILGNGSNDPDVWLMIDQKEAENNFGVFKRRLPADLKSHFERDSTKLRWDDDTLHIDIGNKTHSLPVSIDRWTYGDRFNNDAIDINLPFIWITSADYLFRIEVDKNFKILRRDQFRHALTSIYALRQRGNKLLVFTDTGLCVVDLESLQKETGKH